jgi:hypothetical protein
VAHPLIHLGYAYELQSKTVAIEALAMGSCFYSSLHKYIDNPRYTKPSPHSALGQEKGLLGVLEKVREDKRFDGIYDHRSGDITKVLEEREEAFLEYWNAWEIVNPNEQFQDAQTIGVGLLTGTPTPENAKYDFFLAHVLTSSHAIRILLPLIPAKFHVSLLRQWWLFTLAVFIAQMRPSITAGGSSGGDGDSKKRNWKYVVDKALNGPHANDAHYVKGKSLDRWLHGNIWLI